jgi:hypothetical protein
MGGHRFLVPQYEEAAHTGYPAWRTKNVCNESYREHQMAISLSPAYASNNDSSERITRSGTRAM